MASSEWNKLNSEERETIESHQETAPVKLSSIIKALGLKVKSSTLPPGISGEIRPEGDSQYVIKVSRHDPERRQRFTVAHEISHYLLHAADIGSGLSDDVLYRSELSDRREAEANRLAADILMPTHLIVDWVAKAQALGVDDVVGYLADKFEVSESAMRIKMESLGF